MPPVVREPDVMSMEVQPPLGLWLSEIPRQRTQAPAAGRAVTVGVVVGVVPLI